MRPILLSLIAAVALIGCARGDSSSVKLASDSARVEISLSPFSFTVRNAAGNAVLTSLADQGAPGPYGGPGATLDRPTYIGQVLAGWDSYHAGEGPWLREARARVLDKTATSTRLQLGDGAEVMELSLALDGPRLHLTVAMQGGARNKTGLSFALPPDEHFFGLGERFATFDHRGVSLYSYAEEGGIGAGEGVPAGPTNPSPNGISMTWFPVPFLLSSQGYGMHVETTSRLEFHLGSERPDAWRLAANSTNLALTLYINADPLQTLNQYTEDTGRPRQPAPWAFGPRRTVGIYQQAEGVDEWRLLRQNHVPTTALDDNLHFLPARSELGREDVLKAWTTQLHAAGFKVLGYYTPYISETFSSAAEDLSFGKKSGYFVKGIDGALLSTFFSSGAPQNLVTIDLTNPGAVAWFQSLLSRSLALGYDGWMHDFGEYLPREAALYDGRRGDEVHNEFPLLSARAAFDLLEKERPGDYLFYVRSGTSGTQAVAPAAWSGDPEASFDETTGLPANLRAGLSLSMSGMPMWGSDISGYKCLTKDAHDKEMYLRWAALGAVSPIMMDDTACFTLNGGGHKWTLWSDSDTVAIYAKHARLHTRLQPYFLTLAREASTSGRPLMLHPFLLAPNEPEARAFDDSFFLGPALFAAPVVRRGLLARDVWLPPGRYVDLESLAAYSGPGRVSLPAPLDKLPLLLVEGQILPLLDPAVETLAPATDGTPDAASFADRLDVRVALAPGTTARLTLADGTRLEASRPVLGTPPVPPLPTVRPDEIDACALCTYAAHEGDVDRLRANGALATDSSIAVEDVRLSATGGPPRRVRWDVLRLP